jgi:hypothetical protein
MIRRSLIPLVFMSLTVLGASLANASTHNLSFTQTYKPVDQELLDEARDRLGLWDKSDVERYFDISEVTVTAVEEVAENFVELRDEFKSDKSLGQIIMVVDQLIALGRKIWPIIEAGRPVITSNFGPAVSVLPRTSDSPDFVAMYLMDNWSAPAQQSYLVEYKNGFGSVVISFRYSVSFQHSGRYEGKGRYLTGLDVAASQIRVGWGFNFNATSTLVNISNRGTMDQPMASATVRINYEAKSFLNEIQSAESFHASGDGRLQRVF